MSLEELRYLREKDQQKGILQQWQSMQSQCYPAHPMLQPTSKHHATISAGYADDLTVAGMIRRLKIWWDKLWELDLDKVLSKITKIEAQSAYNKLHIHASFQA